MNENHPQTPMSKDQDSTKQTVESKSDDALDKAMSEAESALLTPVVPGELPTWAETVNAALDGMGDLLKSTLTKKHVELCDEIAEENPELVSHVEEMRVVDEDLLKAYKELREEAETLRQRAEKTEPREEKLEASTSRLVEAGTEFILNVRKQRQAINTWLMEAHQRDTGFSG